MSAPGEVYAVLWMCSCPEPHIIDTDSEAGAHELAAHLQENGRAHVRVVGPIEPDLSHEEITARLSRLGARLAEVGQ